MTQTSLLGRFLFNLVSKNNIVFVSQQPLSSANFLYELDKITQDVLMVSLHQMFRLFFWSYSASVIFRQCFPSLKTLFKQPVNYLDAYLKSFLGYFQLPEDQYSWRSHSSSWSNRKDILLWKRHVFCRYVLFCKKNHVMWHIHIYWQKCHLQKCLMKFSDIVLNIVSHRAEPRRQHGGAAETTAPVH